MMHFSTRVLGLVSASDCISLLMGQELCSIKMHFHLFLLAPAGISLLATESEHRDPQFCTQTYYDVAESDQPTKLCMQLLGHGGVVNADLILLDGTARGVCDTYNSTTINSLKN